MVRRSVGRCLINIYLLNIMCRDWRATLDCIFDELLNLAASMILHFSGSAFVSINDMRPIKRVISHLGLKKLPVLARYLPVPILCHEFEVFCPLIECRDILLEPFDLLLFLLPCDPTIARMRFGCAIIQFARLRLPTTRIVPSGSLLSCV